MWSVKKILWWTFQEFWEKKEERKSAEQVRLDDIFDQFRQQGRYLKKDKVEDILGWTALHPPTWVEDFLKRERRRDERVQHAHQRSFG